METKTVKIVKMQTLFNQGGNFEIVSLMQVHQKLKALASKSAEAEIVFRGNFFFPKSSSLRSLPWCNPVTRVSDMSAGGGLI